MSLDLQAVSAALHQTREGLDAAGFKLECREQGDGVLVLQLVPTPDACADCLVPKVIFTDIVGEELRTGGIQVGSLEIVYPADVTH